MVRILNQEDLSNHGISAAEVQKSLEIECFKKRFRRKSDLPKKFRDKAMSVSATVMEMGLESFITETNYSYTIWEESKIQPDIKPTKISTQFDNLKLSDDKSNKIHFINSSKSDSRKNINQYSQYINDAKINDVLSNNSQQKSNIEILQSQIESLEGNIEKDVDYTYITEFSAPEMYSNSTNQTEILNESQSTIIMSEDDISASIQPVKKYRGVAINSGDNQLSNIKRSKPKTYRGVTY